MVLFTELERLLDDEENLINDPATYTSTDVAFAQKKDWGNITLDNAGILILKFTLYTSSASYYAYWRIKVGSYYVYAYRSNSLTPGVTVGCAIYLAAGTYDVSLEGSCQGATASFKDFQCGYVKFNDMDAEAEAAYSGSIEVTVPDRVTPMGPLNEAIVFVQCMAYTPSGQTNFENVGDNLTNGVSIAVDSVQQDWGNRSQDPESRQGASARLALPFTVGDAHTITITKDNANTVVNISVIACPWLLGDAVHSPVSLTFSQGSTIYLSLEPLFLNPTKFVGIGKERAITFGSSTDYYDTDSGTDLIMYSYTVDLFDIYTVPTLFFLSGVGGCIGIIGVDMR